MSVPLGKKRLIRRLGGLVASVRGTNTKNMFLFNNLFLHKGGLIRGYV
jgi:hypothetical protein